MEKVNEGRAINVDDKNTDQVTLEVGSDYTNEKVDDKTSFEEYKVLYKGQIDEKCLADYGSIDNEKLWNDTAKEMFLMNQNYIPTEDSKPEKVEESKSYIRRKDGSEELTRSELNNKYKEWREDNNWSEEEYSFDDYLRDIDESGEWELVESKQIDDAKEDSKEKGLYTEDKIFTVPGVGSGKFKYKPNTNTVAYLDYDGQEVDDVAMSPEEFEDEVKRDNIIQAWINENPGLFESKIVEEKLIENKEVYNKLIEEGISKEDFIKKESFDVASEYNLDTETSNKVCESIFNKLGELVENNLIKTEAREDDVKERIKQAKEWKKKVREAVEAEDLEDIVDEILQSIDNISDKNYAAEDLQSGMESVLDDEDAHNVGPVTYVKSVKLNMRNILDDFIDNYADAYAEESLDESKTLQESQISDYTLEEVGKLLKDKGNDFKMQISGSEGKTNWLNIDKDDLEYIYKALDHKSSKTESKEKVEEVRETDNNGIKTYNWDDRDVEFIKGLVGDAITVRINDEGRSYGNSIELKLATTDYIDSGIVNFTDAFYHDIEQWIQSEYPKAELGLNNTGSIIWLREKTDQGGDRPTSKLM